jgi:serine/threonine protein kinase
VFLADSAISGGRVALKLLDRAHEARELEGLIRCRECRHPNLIRLLHVDRLPDGRLYYTMDAADDRGNGAEYRPDTLAARGKIPAAELVPMLEGLLDGLEALHGRKLIHRDIKPENILFVNKVPVLGDIGLAAPSENASMVGTPSFLPPEVLAGRRAPDAASDLYALGRVAYFALTGLPPREYPRLPKGLPPEAAAVLAFCRAANSGNATVGACRAALHAPPRKRFRIRAAVAALCLCALTAVAAFALLRARGKREFPPPPMPHPRSDAELDAVLKETDAELARKMRQLDADVAATREKMRRDFRVLTEAEYRAAVAELEKRYPVPPELSKRAGAHFEAVRKELFRKSTAVSPFTDEGAAEHARMSDELKRREEQDALYRLGWQEDSLKFLIRTSGATRRGIDLANIEKLFRERRETAAQLSR